MSMDGHEYNTHSSRIIFRKASKRQMNTNRYLHVITCTKPYVVMKQDHQKLQYTTILTYAICKHKLHKNTHPHACIVNIWQKDIMFIQLLSHLHTPTIYYYTSAHHKSLSSLTTDVSQKCRRQEIKCQLPFRTSLLRSGPYGILDSAELAT
jgi:hypothetical protein